MLTSRTMEDGQHCQSLLVWSVRSGPSLVGLGPVNPLSKQTSICLPLHTRKHTTYMHTHRHTQTRTQTYTNTHYMYTVHTQSQIHTHTHSSYGKTLVNRLSLSSLSLWSTLCAPAGQTVTVQQCSDRWDSREGRVDGRQRPLSFVHCWSHHKTQMGAREGERE